MTIYWRPERDGSIVPGPPRLAAIEFGSKAFAQTLIQNELSDEIKAPNTKFLFDPKNLDWLDTEAGPLSALLIRAQCHPTSGLFPAYYWSKEERVRNSNLSEWSFKATIDCKKGPVYCAHDGPLLFDRNGTRPWQAASTCAKLLVGEQPANFIKPLLREQMQSLRLALQRPPGAQTFKLANMD